MQLFISGAGVHAHAVPEMSEELHRGWLGAGPEALRRGVLELPTLRDAA